jgi:hypothetical protein
MLSLLARTQLSSVEDMVLRDAKHGMRHRHCELLH